MHGEFLQFWLRRPLVRGAAVRKLWRSKTKLREAKQWRFGIGIGIPFTVGPMLVVLAHTSRVLLCSALHTRICVFAWPVAWPVCYFTRELTLGMGRRHLYVTSGEWRLQYVASIIFDLHMVCRVIHVNCDFNKKC